MSMKRNVFIAVAGFSAFVVGSLIVSLLSMGISALIPGQSPDRPGQLEESMEEKLKRENKEKEDAKSNESQNETTAVKEEPKQSEEAVAPPAPAAESAPAPYVAPAPVRPQSGPGNYHQEPYYSPPAQTGPGNM
ncbi:MAG: hypothetical protein ACO4AV_15335 [bacterium]